MKPPIPLKSGDEYDAFTRWRHCVAWRRGERAEIKRRYRRRVRRAEKRALNADPEA